MDDETGTATMMAHYACDRCDMTATVVRTTDASVAWLRHMEEHPGHRMAYRLWTWTVLPIPFE